MPEIKISPESVFLLLFLLLFEDRVSVLIMISCILLHECGHILASVFLGVPIKCIRFNIFGARIELDMTLASYISEIIISLAGPAVNIILAGVGIIMADRAGDRLFFFILTNLALALVNLLPVSTLDGGRILCSLVSLFFGTDAAHGVMRFLSFFFIVVLWLVSVFLWFRFEENISLALLCMHLFWTLMIKRG